MHVEARVPIQPTLDPGMFVSGVVIRNEVDFSGFGSEIVNHSQKFKPFLMAVPVVAHAYHGTVHDVQSREQGRGAIAFVVVRHTAPSHAPVD